MIWRGIFDYFRESGFFDGVLRREISPKHAHGRGDSHVVLARLLLTYLYNRTGKHSKGTTTLPTQSVALDEIFPVFEPICTATDVIERLWQMFDFDESNRSDELNIWARLVTFDELPKYDYALLEQAVLAVKAKRRNATYRFPRVRITYAGRMYLENVASHYESFAARFPEVCVRPLFSYACESELASGEYIRPLEKVLATVEKCVYHMMAFYAATIRQARWLGWPDPDEESTECDRRFLEESLLALRPLGGGPVEVPFSQFHGERTIFSIIGYVDDFRIHALRKIDDAGLRARVNETLTEHVSRYLELFSESGTGRQRHAAQSTGLIRAMKERLDVISHDYGATANVPINAGRSVGRLREDGRD
jgi:hypothetical protein